MTNYQDQKYKAPSRKIEPLHRLTTGESRSDFVFTGEFLRGVADVKEKIYTVGHGSGNNYAAFQYSTQVKPNSSIRALITLYTYEACALAIALYRNGQSSFEGEKRIFNCQGGVESFTIQAYFLHQHTGIRVQIGCDEQREVQFEFIDAKLEYL